MVISVVISVDFGDFGFSGHRPRPQYFRMPSRLPTDEALEKIDMIDEMKKKKKKKNSPAIPHLLQAQQALEMISLP